MSSIINDILYLLCNFWAHYTLYKFVSLFFFIRISVYKVTLCNSAIKLLYDSSAIKLLYGTSAIKLLYGTSAVN